MQSESGSRSVVSDSLQPMDYTAHGILQARILKWGVVPSSRNQSLPTRGSNPGLLHCRQILYQLSQGSPRGAARFVHRFFWLCPSWSPASWDFICYLPATLEPQTPSSDAYSNARKGFCLRVSHTDSGKTEMCPQEKSYSVSIIQFYSLSFESWTPSVAYFWLVSRALNRILNFIQNLLWLSSWERNSD